jgi:transcription initiation factor TFIID subunit 5
LISVNSIAISDDNNLIAIGTAEHYIRVFTADGSPLPSVGGEQKSASQRLIGHSAPVYNLSFSSSVDNPATTSNSFTDRTTPYTGPEWLLSCSADGTVRLWHLGLMKQIMIYKGHIGPVFDITWGPFGHYFLTAGHDKKAHLWSTSKASPLRWFVGHDTPVDHCCFHPNGAYAFTAASDRTVRMFSCLNGICVRLFTGHTGYPTAISCSPTGRVLASADDHGIINLWDLASGRLIKRMKGHDRGGIWSLSWNVEGTLLLSGGCDGTVRLWDTVKLDNLSQGKVVGEGGMGTRVDGTGNTSAAGGASTVSAATGGKKKGKGLQVSGDQVSAFPTKQTPVLFVKFTRMNLGIAAGCYQGGP